MPEARSPKLRIGPVVVLSLLVAPVVALFLALVPFGGAPEHVITGVVLLSFASGWTLLVVLSSRLTDQPQRWAIAPAAVMAVAGVMFLTWPGASTNEALWWTWPIVALALVAMMAAGARRHLHTRAKYWLVYPVLAVLALAAIAGWCEAVQEARDRAVIPMRGRLVDIGGRRLFLRVSGAGGPTVVLVPGAGGTASSWGWIEPEVARRTQVAVFDRAGRGWSEDAPAPQDGRQLAADLHSLLSRGRVPGPYVVVGHSFGGLVALTFAADYPRDVAGMVLIDSTHPQMFTRLPTYPGFYNMFRRVSALFPSLARFGLARAVNHASFDSMPPTARDEDRAFWATARQARSERDEWVEAPTLMKQAEALQTLGKRPLIVVTATRDTQPGWLQLQDDLARRSTDSAHRMAPNATHMGLVEERAKAAFVNRAILDVVEAVRTSTPLNGP